VSPRPADDVMNAVEAAVPRRPPYILTTRPFVRRRCFGDVIQVWSPSSRKAGPVVMAFVSASPEADGTHVVVDLRLTRIGQVMAVLVDGGIGAFAVGSLAYGLTHGGSHIWSALFLGVVPLAISNRRDDRRALRDLLLPLVR
jgi:hypothetical protein